MIINPKEFLIKEIPNFHPLSGSRIEFWREQKKRIIEGYWVGGIWMPPTLYFYVNLGTIRLNKKRSLVKQYGTPLLRDLEWDFFRYYTEARGFSGFKNDPIYTSNYDVLTYPVEDLPESCITPDGTPKIFISPEENMSKLHPYNMGPALYENPAKNGLMLGARNTGKSYMVGVGLVLHHFLTDGITEYTEYNIKNPPTVEIIVGAEEAKFSTELLKKTREAFDRLPGAITMDDRSYPSPISKQYRGSWEIGKEVIAEYKKKTSGGWSTKGSGSSIKNRTFRDNPFAAQGTRPILLVLEEIGMFSIAKEVFTNTVDNLRDGLRKTGTLMMLGTGGDMDSGTIDVSEMFYETEKYDILPRTDYWETNNKIGYFIPAYLTLNNHKDDNGYTNIETAKKELMDVRETLRRTKGSSDALHKEIQYKPIVPSEMFLSKSANIFPVIELRRRLTEIQTSGEYSFVEKKVDLFFDPTSNYNGINYEINNSLTSINNYPWEKEDREGAIVMYEEPFLSENNTTPEGAYIIGCDPYRDDSQTGESLAAIYVLKTSKYFNTLGHNEIVASYIGRPYLGKNQVNENLYKLSLFYGNAKIYFENAVGNVKDYFEKIKRLDLLARQPVTIFNKKASYNTGEMITYGYPMSNDKVKWEAIQYLRSWLLEIRDSDTNKRNLDVIPDPALLQELIAFDMRRNTDRVMALVGCILGIEETHNLDKRKYSQDESALSKQFKSTIVNNKFLFPNEKFSKAASILQR